jgi:hypothetical protein
MSAKRLTAEAALWFASSLFLMAGLSFLIQALWFAFWRALGETDTARRGELSPIFGDSLIGQAAAVAD